jgi:Flp pilus assembly protein TadG
MNKQRSRQRGTTTVEFALVAALFFTVLFGVLEFGRAFFVWNTLNEATRRGARVAVVSTMNDTAIAQAAIFGSGGSDSPILSGLNTGHVQVTYLNDGGSATTTVADVRYVRVAIVGYQHTFLIPFFFNTVTAPQFATTLPRESLGLT